MPAKTSKERRTCPSILGSPKIPNCRQTEMRSLLPWILGRNASSKNALAKANAERTANALRQPNLSEIKVPVGIPKMVAVTTPKDIMEIAFPARSGPVICTAVSLANDQKTGSIRAGMKRDNAMTAMCGAAAASAFERENSSRTKTKSRFRARLTKDAVNRGPATATVNAKRVTSRPAWETLTFKSFAIDGNNPTMTNSVVRMVNPPADGRRIGREERDSFADHTISGLVAQYQRRCCQAGQLVSCL